MPTPEVYPTYAVAPVAQPDETAQDLYTIFAILAILGCCALMIILLFGRTDSVNSPRTAQTGDGTMMGIKRVVIAVNSRFAAGWLWRTAP